MNTNGAVYGNMLASDDDINITISCSTHADLEQETNSELIIILAGLNLVYQKMSLWSLASQETSCHELWRLYQIV